MKRLTSITLAVVFLAGTMSFSWAGSDKQDLAIAKSIMANSGITAKQAISRVLKNNTGVVYSYELEDEDDIYFHEIKLIDIEADKKIKLTISLQTGEVVKSEWERLFSWFFDDEHIVTAKKLASMKYSMLDAIDTIAIDEQSILTEIDVEDKQGVLFFELETKGANGKQEWLVDANNNQLIPVFKK